MSLSKMLAGGFLINVLRGRVKWGEGKVRQEN